MKLWMTSLILLLSITVLTGCGSEESSASAAPANPQAGQGGAGGPFGGEPFQSAFLNRDYEGALSETLQLSLGTLALEETSHAITVDQAKKLTPLWQGIQGGAFQNAQERNAVFKQIEGTMTPDQMNEIAAMQLTFESMAQWAEANGIQLPEGRLGGGGGGGPFANMSEEERVKFREEMQNMTPEQRQARLREMGIETPQDGQAQRGQGRRGGSNRVIIEPLIALLTARAAE